MDGDPDKSIDEGFSSKPTKQYKTDNERKSRSSTVRSGNEKSQKNKGAEQLDTTISQSASTPIMVIPPAVSLPFTVEQRTDVSPKPLRMTSSNDSNITLNETEVLNGFKNSTEVDNSTVILFRVVTVLFTIKMIIRTVQFVFKVGLSGAYWTLQLWKHVKVRRSGGKKNGTTDVRCLDAIALKNWRSGGPLSGLSTVYHTSVLLSLLRGFFRRNEHRLSEAHHVSANFVNKKAPYIAFFYRLDLELTSNGYDDEPTFVKDFINGEEMPEMTVFFHLALILYCLKTIFWLIKLIIGFRYQMRRFLENKRNRRKSKREDQQHGDEEAVATVAAELKTPPVLAPCTVSLSNEARYKAAPPTEDSDSLSFSLEISCEEAPTSQRHKVVPRCENPLSGGPRFEKSCDRNISNDL